MYQFALKSKMGKAWAHSSYVRGREMDVGGGEGADIQSKFKSKFLTSLDKYSKISFIHISN